MKTLRPKQQRFVEEYLVDLNATQAALRANYSPKTAAFIGAENLRKPQIQHAIQAAQAARARRTEITQDRVLKEYARLAFLDPRKFYDAQGNLKPIHELDDDTAAALASIEITLTSSDDEAMIFLKKIKTWNKNKALQDVARHLGLFNDQLHLVLEDGHGLASLIGPSHAQNGTTNGHHTLPTGA